jgi:predicted nucleic acid-binding protein
VLVYAHREDAPNHAQIREWLERTISDPAPFGLCDPVMSGFMRVVTHARIFDPPSSIDDALVIESGNEWVSTDRNFARFPGLRWHHPLE